MSETLDIGSDSTTWGQIRRRAALTGAATIAALLLSEQSTAVHDDGYHHAGFDTAPSSAVRFVFDPHHQAIEFTPIGSVLVRAGHTTNPVGVSFENVHCQQHQVWGGMDVFAGDTLDRFGNIALPVNSLFFDCFMDNDLDGPSDSLSIGTSTHRYRVER